MTRLRIISERARVSVGLRCPYCFGEIAKGWTCGSCATLHHEECMGAHGGCVVFGCRGGRRPRVLVTAAEALAPPRAVVRTDPWRVVKTIVRVVVALVLLAGLALAGLLYAAREAFKDLDHGGHGCCSKIDDDVARKILASSNDPAPR